MGYMEMIKRTDSGHVAVIFDDEGQRTERAFQCDDCRKLRPESTLLTEWLYDGDCYMTCDECRAK